MRTIFLGTPSFAVPTLKELLSFSGVEVVGVVTQPDRPSGRGNKLTPPPCKITALEHGIPVLQPERLSRSPETVEAMRALKPDLIVMVAFGQILKKEVLTMPPHRVINVHASLLPSYRGAAPINWAIINGETISGVTTMFTEAGVDTGPMLLKREIAIGPDMTAEELADAMSVAGADLLIDTVQRLIAGTLVPEQQDDARATLAPMLNKEMGKIDWQWSAQKIHNLVRGLVPWPGTTATFRDQALKINRTRVNGSGEPADPLKAGIQPRSQTELPARPQPDGHAGLPPGTLLKLSDEVLVACGSEGLDRLVLVEVQPPNKARMSARDWANGARIAGGELLQ